MYTPASAPAGQEPPATRRSRRLQAAVDNRIQAGQPHRNAGNPAGGEGAEGDQTPRRSRRGAAYPQAQQQAAPHDVGRDYAAMARRARRTPPPRPEQVGDDPNATLVFDAVEDSDDSGDETPDSAGQRDSNGRDPSGGGETEADARGHSPARRVRSTDRQFTDVMVDTEIAEVISSWTGIPVGKLMTGEQKKLL